MWNELSWGYQQLTDDKLQAKLKKLHKFKGPEIAYGKVTLSVNNLTCIPNLRNNLQFNGINKLWLDGNKIAKIQVESIPVSLRVLNINRNEIREIPDISYLNFHELYMGNNKIRSINVNYLPVTIRGM